MSDRYDTSVLKYDRGAVIVFTSGEYSDYGVVAYLVTLAPLDLAVLAAEYRAGYKPEYEGDKADYYGFAGWLVAEGLAMPVDHNEVWLGAYSDWTPELAGDGHSDPAA